MRNKLLVACLWSVLAFSAQAVEHPLPNEEQELRAEALFHEIRCVTCQTESVAESPADIASDIRTTIRKRIALGDSNSEIKTYLASRYGTTVIMQPALNKETAILWFGPTIILIAGIIIIWISLKLESLRNR